MNQVLTKGIRKMLIAVAALGFAAMVTRMAPVAILPAIQRASGAEGLGLYGLASLTGASLALLIAGGTTLSLGGASPVPIKTRDARHLFWSRGITTLVMVAALVVGFQVWSPSTSGVAWIVTAFLLDGVSELPWAHGRTRGTATKEALVMTAVIAPVILLAGVAAASGQGLQLQTAGLVLSAAALAKCLVGYQYCLRVPEPPTTAQQGFAEVRRLYRESRPLLLADILGILYLRVDLAVISIIRGPNTLGIYVAAAAFTTPLVQIGSAMAYAALGSMKEPAEEATARPLSPLALLSVIGLAAASASYIAAELTGEILFRTIWEPAEGVFAVLILYIPLRFVNFGLSVLALHHGQLRDRLRAVAGAVVASITLNTLLVPNLGAIGAAYSAIGTEFVIFAILSEATRRTTGKTLSRLRVGVLTYGAAVLLLVGARP